MLHMYHALSFLFYTASQTTFTMLTLYHVDSLPCMVTLYHGDTLPNNGYPMKLARVQDRLVLQLSYKQLKIRFGMPLYPFVVNLNCLLKPVFSYSCLVSY